MTKASAGVWAGSFLFLFSLLFFFESLKFPLFSELGPGPGFFPTGISGFLLVLSIIYIIESYRGKNVSEEKWPKWEAMKNILFIMGGLFAFVILFALFGFFPACAFFLYLMFSKGYRWHINLLLSIGITLFLFWLFNNVLGVLLPIQGVLF